MSTSPRSSRDGMTQSVTKRLSSLLSSQPPPPTLGGDREATFWIPGPHQVMYTDPIQATGSSSVYSAKSPANERMSESTRGSRRSTVGSQHTEELCKFTLGLTSSGPLSPLGAALTTRVGVWTQKTSGQQAGIITAATMEGLIYLLLRDVEKDTTEHEVFFIAHLAFISPLDVLRMLFRRFEEAWKHQYEVRHDIQTRIMHLINRWLRSQHVIFSLDDLIELNKFITTVEKLKTLDGLVREAMDGINEKELLLKPPPSPTLPSFDSAIGTEPTSCQLAMALAKLEGEKYQCIRPGEYVAHAGNCRLDSFTPNLTAALVLNKRINYWVQSYILDMDNLESRCNIKRFFLETAKACQDICNFSSLGAIMEALQSKAISSLTLTHERMSRTEQNLYQELVNLLKSDFNYAKYRHALSKVKSRSCIPWHVVHLHDIRSIMQENDVDDKHDPPLINFEKWAHLKGNAMSASQYRDMCFMLDSEGDNHWQAGMDYLKKVLKDIEVREDFSRDLQKKSEKLVKNESLARAYSPWHAAGFS